MSREAMSAMPSNARVEDHIYAGMSRAELHQAALDRVEHSRTDADLIARQAKRLEELRDEVADLRGRMQRAWSHIYCIGGPLNDNKLGYSKSQMLTFYQIAKELDA